MAEKPREVVSVTRNWKEDNGELVKRGEFYLNPDFLESWDEEIEEMNEGKVGRPYKIPESFVQVAALWHDFLLVVPTVARCLEKAF